MYITSTVNGNQSKLTRSTNILAGARLRSPLVLGKLEISLRYNNLISVGYLEGSERGDLAQIKKILSQIGVDQQQRAVITDVCWMQAQKILSDYQLAGDALATALVKRGSLTGRAAHRLIWQTVGYPDNDWRFLAFGIKR